MKTKIVFSILLVISFLMLCMPATAYTAEEIALNQAIWLNEHGYQVSGTYEEIEKIYREIRYGVHPEDYDDDDDSGCHIVPYPAPTPKDDDHMF